MSTVQHKFIQTRADFFRELDSAITISHRLLGTPQGWGPLESIVRQLEAMRTWTASARTPTKEERRSTVIGRILVREFEPVGNDEIYDLTQHLYEIEFYFKLWIDDAEWQHLSKGDPRTKFPDDDPR